MAGEIEFIGREKELSQILQMVTESGTSQSLFIRGVGGIGKTRLLQKVREQILEYKYERQKNEGNISVALVQEFTASEWSHEFINGARDMAARLGVILAETDANYNFSTMADQLNQVIDQKPDAIIVSLGSSEELRNSIERAIELGINVLTFDNHLEDIDGITAKVHQDDYEGARLTSEQMAEDIGFQGKIATVWAEGNPSQQRRRDVLHHILRKYSQITVVGEFGKMTPDTEFITYTQTKELLQKHPDLKAIWTVFNEFARGVMRALIEENRTDILLYSFDLCASDIKLISQDNSPWRATAAINPAEAGRIIVRLATLAVSDARYQIKRYYSLPMKLVTQHALRTSNISTLDWDQSDIGWTASLRTLSVHGDKPDTSNLLFANEIIDFADSSLLIAENIELRLAKVLGDKRTLNFIRALQTLRKMQQGEFHSDTIKKQKDEVTAELVKAFNEFTKQQRLILFFDTTERIDPEMYTRLVNLVSRFNNTLSIFARRSENRELDETDFWEALLSIFQHITKTHIVNLQPFAQDASKEYLIAKQQQLSIIIPSDLAEILLIMSNGRPILLDLAAEYVFRNIEIDNLAQIDIEKYKALPDNLLDKIQLIKKFEAELVRHIRELRNRIDWLTLITSRIYPITEEMIAKLLNVSIKEAQGIFNEALSFSFIKLLPNEKEITLHDEMQRMILEYVWEEIDPDEDQRRNDSRLAVEIYNSKEQELEIQDLHLKNNSDITTGEKEQQFTYEEIIKRNRQDIAEKRIHHALYADIVDGFNEWFKLIEGLRSNKRYNFTLRLCHIASDYFKRFDEEGKYLYRFSYYRALADAGKLYESKSLLQKLLEEQRDDKYKRSDILNQLGSIFNKLGEPQHALAYQIECLSLYPQDDRQGRARIHNQIGYNYRLLDDFKKENRKKAEYHYDQSITIASSLDSELSEDSAIKRNRSLIASASNNLGYLYGLNRQYDRADVLFQRAIRTWQGIGQLREIARTETSQGILARNQGYYDQAVRLFNNAIERLVEPDDYEQLCRAHFHLGWTLWFKAIDYITDEIDLTFLEEAVISLQKSQEYAEEYQLEREQPGIYHQLASVIWRIGILKNEPERCKQARQLNNHALELSYKLNNIRYAVDSLVGKAEFDLDIGREDFIEEYAAELKKKFERKKYNFPLYYGRMRRIRGDFAFYRGDFEDAFSMYAEGFFLINKHGGFGPYLIEHELRHLSQKIQTLPRTDALKWLHYLQMSWVKSSRTYQHMNLNFWCNQEIQQTQLSSLT